LKDKAIEFESTKVEIPQNIDHLKLLADAQLLNAHFGKGKGKGFGLFAAKVVKQGRYIFKSIKINGLLCESPDQAPTVQKTIRPVSGLKSV